MKIIRHTLQYGRYSLETHSRIHARPRQRDIRAVRLSIELHEDEIPELEESTFFRPLNEGGSRKLCPCGVRPFSRGTGRKREVVGDRSKVDINFTARAAGASVSHLPEVVCRTQPIDT